MLITGDLTMRARRREFAAACAWIGASRFPTPITATLIVTLAKFAAFVALMLIVGRKLIPWVLHYVAHTGSRELFRLAVLAIAFIG